MPGPLVILDDSNKPYVPKDFWDGVWNVITSIVSSIASALVKTVTTAAKELASMLTLDRLVGVGINYGKQQASTWLTHSVMNLGHQQWLANLLHAMGLDFSDLLRVGKDALNAGFGQLNIGVMSALKEAGVLSAAGQQKLGGSIDKHSLVLANALSISAGLTHGALADHAALTSKAYGDWSMFQSRSYSSEEEKNRAMIAAIFMETPERTQQRAGLESAQAYVATGDAVDDSYERKLPGVIGSLGAIIGPLQNFLNEQFLAVRNGVYTLLVPTLPVSYEQVGVSAVGAFVTAFSLGLTSHAVAVAADLVHPLKATGIPQLAAFLADMAGFGAIARETWYTDLQNFLGTPYRHYSLRYFRPTMPGPRDVLELFASNHILEDDADKGLGYLGFRDEWIRAMKLGSYRHARLYDMSLMVQDATISTNQIYDMLRDAGYKPEHAEVMAGQVLKKSLSSYMSSYRSALLTLFELGYITEESFDAQLEPLGLSSESLFLMKKTARFEFIKEFTNLSVNMFKDMYEKDLIDDNDLDVSLAGLGIVEEKRDIIVSAEKVKRAGKVAAEEKAEIKKALRTQQKLTIDTAVLQYRTGTIDEDGLLHAIISTGVSADLATITVTLERQKRLTAETRKKADTVDSLTRSTLRKLEDGYIDLFRKGYIDGATLGSYLVLLGLSADDAIAIVNLELAKKEKAAPVGLG